MKNLKTIFMLALDVITTGSLGSLIPRIIGVAATVLFFLSESFLLAIISLIVLIIVWASGYLMIKNVQNLMQSGAALNQKEASDLIPNGLAAVNMISTIASFVLLIISLVVFF